MKNSDIDNIKTKGAKREELKRKEKYKWVISGSLGKFRGISKNLKKILFKKPQGKK